MEISRKIERANDTIKSLGQATKASEEDNRLVEVARCVLKARTAALRHIPRGIFRDEAWDILLVLFISRGEGGKIIVKDLMATCGATPTGTMRRIDALERAGLIKRSPSPRDHRRVRVELTADGHHAMKSLIQDLRKIQLIEPSGENPDFVGNPHGFTAESAKQG